MVLGDTWHNISALASKAKSRATQGKPLCHVGGHMNFDPNLHLFFISNEGQDLDMDDDRLTRGWAGTRGGWRTLGRLVPWSG